MPHWAWVAVLFAVVVGLFALLLRSGGVEPLDRDDTGGADEAAADAASWRLFRSDSEGGKSLSSSRHLHASSYSREAAITGFSFGSYCAAKKPGPRNGAHDAHGAFPIDSSYLIARSNDWRRVSQLVLQAHAKTTTPPP